MLCPLVDLLAFLKKQINIFLVYLLVLMTEFPLYQWLYWCRTVCLQPVKKKRVGEKWFEKHLTAYLPQERRDGLFSQDSFLFSFSISLFFLPHLHVKSENRSICCWKKTRGHKQTVWFSSHWLLHLCRKKTFFISFFSVYSLHHIICLYWKKNMYLLLFAVILLS